MSFGGFGGFGQNNNNQQQSSTFGGGFGQNNNTTTTSGFGSNTSGFGQSNTPGGGGLFGGNNANPTTNTTSGFGGGAGGFGSGTGFGAKPAFGSTTNASSGGLFGSSATNNSTSAGFSGFGGNTSTNTSSPFGGGSSTTGGGMFGSTANKPAFGASTTTGGSLFGGGSNTTATTSGFGGGFGATNNAAVGDPPGTAVAPFQAYTEKETNGSTNSFQNILFQDPYKKWSGEELRLADYVQGRRHGNASGGGAFGVASNFGGGFGTNNQTSGFGSNTNTTTTNTGGLFGSGTNAATNNTSTGFGATNNAFGSNTNATGGSLFGSANKPAGGGLFGSGTTQQNTGGFGAGQTGGAFGSTPNTTSAFGSSNTGGGLFGANKPQTGGGLFGSGGTNTNTATSGFGSTGNAFSNTNTNTGGGLFGNNNATGQAAGGGLFGSNTANQQPQQNTGGVFGGGGAFGQQNQSQQTGNSLFGNNNQQKPATTGLFGSTPAQPAASGGLFGGANQQQNTGAFGTNNSATSGGLFGAAKPNTGTGLFGGANTQTNANTTGLFGGLGGNNQNQAAAGTGLFGAASNNQQQKTGLFGSSTQNANSSPFGASANQGSGTGLFGSMNNQQQQGGLGGSLLGNSQQANNAPQGLTANLNDVSAYGSPSLFSSLHNTEVNNPGPLATPLNNSAKPKRGSILAMSKMAPSSASRYGTPQKRAYGFSYSTYGTPGGSPASSIASTPGTLGRSLLGSSSSGSLNKSMSVNNLRRNFNTEDSILAPGAFSSSSGPRWYGSTGSKKLVISRDIRSDLFSTPQKDKHLGDAGSGSRKLAKRVSFEVSNPETDGEVQIRGALPAPEDSPSTQAEDTPRQNRQSALNGSRTPNGDPAATKDLRDIREEDPLATPSGSVAGGADKSPGEYYSKPTLEEIQSMNRIQRQSIDNFVIGRENVGSIRFKYPVDVTAIEPEELFGGIIQLEPRSATVYPNSARKPPVGKGLNVPAQISLEQSWPRSRGEKRLSTDEDRRVKKHIDRLQRIENTTFESYNKDTGVWVFSVEHFTTYGLDDSEDEDEDTELVDQTPSRNVGFIEPAPLDMSFNSEMEDDTFDFRQSHGLPGAFHQPTVMEQNNPTEQSFLGVSSADSAPNNVPLSIDEYTQDMGEEYDVSDDEDMTRSFAGQHHAAEQDDVSSEADQEAPLGTPGGVLRARMRAIKDSVEPAKIEVADGDDWMEMLRKTVSPVKRDRQVLKLRNESPRYGGNKLVSFDDDEPVNGRASVWKKSTTDRLEAQANSQAAGGNRGFATSIDLMNSLFEKPQPTPLKARASTSTAKGFPQWPYERQEKNPALQESEKAFHDAGRPTWGPDETVVLTRPLDSASHVVRIRTGPPEPSKKFLGAQDKLTEIRMVDSIPFASLRKSSLEQLFHGQDMNSPASVQEQRVWQLASILFDDLPGNQTVSSRRENLSSFWTDLVDSASSTSIGLARSSEEKAVASLAGHRITEACKHLFDGKNFRLAALVALIGTSDLAKKDMKEQVKDWHESKVLSEFSDPIRVIYELLSGNTCVCEGIKNVPVEDRMESFVISHKFGLDWRQAFGLRLWYGISQLDQVEAAVEDFAEDVKQDKEAKPLPWFQAHGIEPLWKDPHPELRQDLLWCLLRLYADKTTDLEATLHPANSQLSPLDMRLSWQLGLALVSTGKVSYGESADYKADAATVAYASQLTAAGEWLEAIFVLLHLSDATARTRAIQQHICHHAGLIGPEAGPNFTTLTDKFLIPTAWVWEALALYNRSVLKDPAAEVQCLLKASSFVEAHRVLIREVAPRAIIERGYAELASLISQFDGQHDAIPEWHLGGEIYGLFLSLLQHRKKGEMTARSVLDRLLVGLHTMSDNVSAPEILRYAAISDMADETAKEILHWTRRKQDAEFRSRILQLPLTQDRLLAYSVDLGMERYMEVMSH